MALFVLNKLILQTRMRCHPVGLDVWFLVGPFVFLHPSCVRTAKAVARLRRCAGSSDPSLVAYVISTIISWAGSNSTSLPRLLDVVHSEKKLYLVFEYLHQDLKKYMDSCPPTGLGTSLIRVRLSMPPTVSDFMIAFSFIALVWNYSIK